MPISIDTRKLKCTGDGWLLLRVLQVLQVGFDSESSKWTPHGLPKSIFCDCFREADNGRVSIPNMLVTLVDIVIHTFWRTHNTHSNTLFLIDWRKKICFLSSFSSFWHLRKEPYQISCGVTVCYSVLPTPSPHTRHKLISQVIVSDFEKRLGSYLKTLVIKHDI